MSDIELAIDAKKKQESEQESLESSYSEWTPHLSEVSGYFLNVFVQEEGREKFKPLIGEQGNALTALAALVLADTPVVFKSMSGAGKTVAMNAIWSLLEDHLKYELDMASGVAVWYEEDKINNSRFVMLPELQNTAENKEIANILKKFGEGKGAHRSVTDIASYTAGGEGTREHKLQWKPFFTSFAVENETAKKIFNEEFDRRCVMLYTDVSTTQTRRVIDFSLKVWEEGVDDIAFMSDIQRSLLKHHIVKCQLLKDALKSVRAPFAGAISDVVPDNFVVSRSAVNLLSKVVNGIGVFNYKERIITDDDNLLLAPEDLWYAMECYGEQFIGKCYNLPLLANDILACFKGGDEMTLQELRTRLKDAHINVGKKRLEIIMEEFEDSGILESKVDAIETVKRYSKTWDANTSYNIDWKYLYDYCERVVKEKYPDHADEYIERHLRTSTFKHPFEPKEVNILTGEEKPFTRKW